MAGNKDVVELTLYEGYAIFSNGTRTQDEVYILRNETNSMKYRGFMVQVEDIGFWEDAETCFVSEPIIHTVDTSSDGETWFTENHKHDIGSIQYKWFYVLLFADKIFGN